MRRKIALVLFSLFIFALTIVTLLFFRGGLRQFIRASRLVNNLPVQDRHAGIDLFYGNTSGNEYGGIYAGTTNIFKPLIWVWGKNGLKFFVADEFSVYWHVDGCNLALSEDNNRIVRKRDPSLSDWENNVEVGDYIMVVVTTEDMGGTKGNLREVLSLDWWPFLQKGMEEECKK